MKTKTKQSKIYFNSDLHKALRVKAAVTHHSMSEIVNECVKRSLGEDAEDLAAFEERAKEPNLDLEDVLKVLKKAKKVRGTREVYR